MICSINISQESIKQKGELNFFKQLYTHNKLHSDQSNFRTNITVELRTEIDSFYCRWQLKIQNVS